MYNDIAQAKSRYLFKLWLLSILKPKHYNNPTCIQMLYNQWLHMGYMAGLYSYEFYSEHQLNTIKKANHGTH